MNVTTSNVVRLNQAVFDSQRISDSIKRPVFLQVRDRSVSTIKGHAAKLGPTIARFIRHF